MRFSPLLTGWTALFCLMLVACVGGRPIHYYSINPPTAASATSRPDGPILLIGRIATPEALQDGRIRYRSGSNEVGAYEYHRWMERPASIVQDLLLRTLRASGKYRQVQEASTAAAGDYLVRGKLYELEEIDNPGIRTRVSLRLELLDRKTGMVVWNHHYDRDESVEGKTMHDVVHSLERNLEQVITEAASGIDAFLSNPAASISGPRLVLTRIASSRIFGKRWASIKWRVSGVNGASRDTTWLSVSSSSSGTSGHGAAVEGDHFAAKAVGDTGDYTTDLSKAEDPEGAPV